MQKKIPILILVFSVLQFYCNRVKERQTNLDVIAPAVTEAREYKVPQDQIAPPEIIPIKEIKSKATAKPKVIKLKSNIHGAGRPKVVKAAPPKICVPGKNGFSFPVVMPAIDSSFPAGIPEVTVARDPETKPSASFSSFTVKQGLKSNWIYPVIQDRSGNLWIATTIIRS